MQLSLQYTSRKFMFCIITYSKRTPIWKVMGHLFFGLECTQIDRISFSEKRV